MSGEVERCRRSRPQGRYRARGTAWTGRGRPPGWKALWTRVWQASWELTGSGPGHWLAGRSALGEVPAGSETISIDQSLFNFVTTR